MSQTEQTHSVFNFFPDLEHVFQFRADCWRWWQKQKSHGGLVTWRTRSSICNYRYLHRCSKVIHLQMK